MGQLGDLQGGYGAGGGADALQEILKQAFLRQVERKRQSQEDQRIALEQQRTSQAAQFQKAQLDALSEERAARAEGLRQASADKLEGSLNIGDPLDASQSGALTGALRGNLIRHQPGTLASTAIGGTVNPVQSGPTEGSPLRGTLTMTPQAAKPPGPDVYAGNPAQRKQAEKDAALKGFLSDPQADPRLKTAIGFEDATGRNIPGELLRDRSQEADDAEQRRRELMAFGASLRPPSQAEANRGDRSYQYHVTALERLRKPYDDLNLRLTKLHESLAQGTPQADAIVAPELLTVMAGGQGSGLRMNEAEISRIVGGRSHWENLRAAAQKWSLDPKTANSITPDQRKQIRDLLVAVERRAHDANSVFDEAGNQMVAAEDPAAHRRIFNETRRKLSAITNGEPTGGNADAASKAADLIKKYGG